MFREREGSEAKGYGGRAWGKDEDWLQLMEQGNNMSEHVEFKDKYLQAIRDDLCGCSSSLHHVEHKWGTFPKAWKKCDDALLYGWLIGRLAIRNDYYRRAALSVLSQILYEFHSDQDERIGELTRMVDGISEGKDELVKKTRVLATRIVKNFYKKTQHVYLPETEDAIQVIDCICSFLSRYPNEFTFDDVTDTGDKKMGKRICQLIRKMVDRPTVQDIKDCNI
jgi:hypothetical protein